MSASPPRTERPSPAPESERGDGTPIAREVPVFILCGGLGTRLRAVESRPKALVPMAGIPFIGYLVRALDLQGFQKVHFLLGHGAEETRRVLGGEVEAHRFDPRYDPRVSGWLERLRGRMDWRFELEPEPMGTGGALGRVRDQAADINLVLNGDSYTEMLYGVALSALRASGRAAELVAVWMDQRSDYGGLELAAGNRVVGFREKGEAGAGWINSGVYSFRREVFDALVEGPSSLERDVLPRLAEAGRLGAVPVRCYFRDIGTPERWKAAREELQVWRKRMEDGGEL